jgi:hypothetical protein
MALQKTVNTPHGFLANNAYHRVEDISLINKNSLIFQVKSYASGSNKNLAFNTVFYTTNYNIEVPNPIKQAYEHLKTLPEFNGAIDC